VPPPPRPRHGTGSGHAWDRVGTGLGHSWDTLRALKAFRLGKGRRRNPLVPLPQGADASLASVTEVLVTHVHPDHLDRSAIDWIRDRRLRVWCSPRDRALLQRVGLDARPFVGEAQGWRVAEVPTAHGFGIIGWMMGAGSGFVIATDAGTVYVTGDTRLTDDVRRAIRETRPALTIAPAGAANFGIGPDILFSVHELVELAHACQGHGGHVIFHHLEALDHCPTTRAALRARLASEGLEGATHVPDDGASVSIEVTATTGTLGLPAPAVARGPRAWLTGLVARWLLR